MENRLCLNEKPVFELPDEVLVGEYLRFKDREKKPDFKPDRSIMGYSRNIKVDSRMINCRQLWIKTDNKELLDFIDNYDWNNSVYSTSRGGKRLEVWKFKKIILEEFYEVKYGE